MKTRILGILLIGGLARLLSAGLVYAGGPSVKVHGTSACSYINAPMTFDGYNYAYVDTCTGHDNFGTFIGQKMGAYLFVEASNGQPITGPACTAPDGTPAQIFELEFAEFVNTYNFNNDQIWGYSTNGSICASDTSGSFSVVNEFKILGGSGLFAGATGTVTQKQSMVIGTLYEGNYPPFAPYYLPFGSSPLSTGGFGQDTSTWTGTITP